MYAPRELSALRPHTNPSPDLGWVAELLAEQREEILSRWLDGTAGQPLPESRSPKAGSPHIPRVFDALTEALHPATFHEGDVEPPRAHSAVLHAAHEHTHAGLQQGLRAAEIIAEFRLLRQEIGRALHRHSDAAARAADVASAELLINDALDAAIALALAAMSSQVDEVRDELLAGVVHDVQQPMTAIKGNLQLALRGLARVDGDVGGIREAVQRAHAETDRMGDLMATLTEASRLALGRMEPRRSEVDLPSLVADVVARCDESASSRITLEVAPGPRPTGFWDPVMLQRVVGNLLSNAAKYSPPGSPIQVTVAGGDEARLAVHDRGLGLTPDEVARLFQRYSRGQAAIDSGVQGLGLGLYLSRGIVEAHGGRIWCQSAGPGQGTSFYVVLPCGVGRDTGRPLAEGL